MIVYLFLCFSHIFFSSVKGKETKEKKSLSVISQDIYIMLYLCLAYLFFYLLS